MNTMSALLLAASLGAGCGGGTTAQSDVDGAGAQPPRNRRNTTGTQAGDTITTGTADVVEADDANDADDADDADDFDDVGIAVILGGAADDSYEPNDVAAQARGLPCGSSVEGFAAAGNDDWFFVDVADGEVHATLTGTTDTDLDLFLFEGTRQLDASESATGQEHVMAMNVTAGRYSLLMRAWVPQTGTAEGGYGLSVGCTPATTTPPPDVPDPTEPAHPVDPSDPGDGPDPPNTHPEINGEDDLLEDNDEPQQAPALSCNHAYQLIGLDDDWFAVAVQEGETLTAEVEGAVAEVAIVDGLGLVLSGNVKAAEASDLPAGLFLVKVAPTAAGGGYGLQLRCSEFDVDSTAAGGCSSTTAAPSLLPLPLLLLLLLLLLPQWRHRRLNPWALT